MKRVFIFVVLMMWLVAACTDQTDAEPPVFETGVDPESWALIPAGEYDRLRL